MGAIEAVIRAMHTHKGIAAVEDQGCGAIQNLAFK